MRIIKFRFWDKDKKVMVFPYGILIPNYYDYKIVGNIYENPELLI